MRNVPLLLLLALPALADEPPVEAQLALQSLREGERARLEAVLGDATRLPLYRAELTVDPAAHRVKGRVFLSFTATAPSVGLRLTPNAAHPEAVVLSAPSVNGGTVALEATTSSLLTARFEPPLKPGEDVTLGFELEAEVPALPKDQNPLLSLSATGPAGDYGAFAYSADCVSLVGLLPMLVPEVNGHKVSAPTGIGDLGTAAPSNFLISVAVPKAWRVVTGGAALGDIPTRQDTVRYVTGLAAAREFPLLLLKGASVKRDKVGGVWVEAVLLSDRKQLWADVLGDAKKFLAYLEAKLSPYPYQTLRIAEARLTNGAGGMEFPGMVTLASTLLSNQREPLEAMGVDEGTLQALQAMLGVSVDALLRDTQSFALAHELAHQWTALLIGSDPIADPLADEALTQHLALLALEGTKGKKVAGQVRSGQLEASYQLHRMVGGVDGLARRATSEFHSNREYAALVYGKAPLLFDEQRRTVGDVAWFKALKTYAAEHRYQWVTSNTFEELLEAQNPPQAKLLKRLQTRWWDEAHGDEDLASPTALTPLGSVPGLQGGQMDEEMMKALGKQLEELLKSQ